MDKAYVHYLYAQSIADVIRFMDMGYGKGVFCESPRLLDLNEYHTLMLLWTAGEREYAEYRINWLASCWIYDSAEKEATKKTEAQEHRTYALCRRQVCEWMMEKNAEDVDIEKFTLFMGAYLSYLKNGHEGSCSYVYEYSDGKCNETSVWAAEKYIAEALEAGKFAIRGKAFMDAVKEAKNE